MFTDDDGRIHLNCNEDIDLPILRCGKKWSFYLHAFYDIGLVTCKECISGWQHDYFKWAWRVTNGGEK